MADILPNVPSHQNLQRNVNVLGILKKYKKYLPLTFLLLLTIPIFTFKANAEMTGYLAITADASTESANVHNTHGTDTNLIVQTHPTSGIMWTYLAVNISTLTHVIKSAYLELYVVNFDSSDGRPLTVACYNSTADWDETTIDWNSQPLLGELQEYNHTVNTHGWEGQATYLDVTDAVLSAQNNGEDNVSLVITNEGINNYAVMFSREETDAVYINRLYYVYEVDLLPSATPEPTSTPDTQVQQQNTFMQVAIPLAAVGVPALIMAVFLGKWGFISGATIGATFGFLAIPNYIPYWVPLFVGLGTVSVLFLSFRST